MGFTNSDLLALKQELTNDPKTLGLTVLSADDEANADKLNLVRVILPVKRRSVPTSDILNAVTSLEHQGMSDQQSRWLSDVLSLGQIDPLEDANIVAGLAGIFGAGTNSGPAITATLSQSGSRIEQLFQAGALSQGGQVTPSDIANARSAV